jgi:ribosomal protein S27E
MIWKVYECPKCYNTAILCRHARVRCNLCAMQSYQPWMMIKEWIQ